MAACEDRRENETFQHVRSLIREARDRHAHAGGADEAGDEDEEVRAVAAGHVLADLLGDRDEEHARDRVADKRRDDLLPGGKRALLMNRTVAGTRRRKGRTRTMTESRSTTGYKSMPEISSRMPSPSTSNSPLFVTPFPSAMPPMAMKTTVHKNCSKSSCARPPQHRTAHTEHH